MSGSERVCERTRTQPVRGSGEIYALGGRWRVGLNSVEVYNPAADEWRLAQPMHTARAGHGAALLESEIYVLGGAVSNQGRVYAWRP